MTTKPPGPRWRASDSMFHHRGRALAVVVRDFARPNDRYTVFALGRESKPMPWEEAIQYAWQAACEAFDDPHTHRKGRRWGQARTA